jgi:hypothetical protein
VSNPHIPCGGEATQVEYGTTSSYTSTAEIHKHDVIIENRTSQETDKVKGEEISFEHSKVPHRLNKSKDTPHIHSFILT